MHWDVVVVGAGAAGLLAAARAAELGRRTLLLEKNRKPGVKILMSGGTRCNLTHDTDRRGIIEAFDKQGRFLHSALAALGPRELVELIEAEGVATKIEDTGKIFPVSNRATDVLDALLRRLRRSGATLSLDERLTSLEVAPPGFRLLTAREMISADRVIVTTGGKSYPGCGTVGDGYGWAKALGHTIVAPRPALTPVASSEAWISSLRGITLPDVEVRVIESQIASDDRRAALDRRRGSFLFAHFGLSGPAPLDISRTISGHPDPKSLKLVCDFHPAWNDERLAAAIQQECSSAGKREIASVVCQWLPHRLAETLLQISGLRSEQRAAEMSKVDRSKLVRAIKHQAISVSGTLGFEKAEVTAGGLSLDEIDSRTMQSKLVPNLYFAGEVLDLDGPIGGYNFQAAFSTGWLAGQSAAE
jgi:predicted Rossmann fold flavoprotein